MKSALWSLIVLPGLCAGVLAQAGEPRPNRVVVEEYGDPSTSPCGMRLSCMLRESDRAVIRMAGGIAHTHAILLVASAKAKVEIPGLGTLLVAPTAKTYVGMFDAAGYFDVPVDLTSRELAGVNVYMQGWQVYENQTFDHSNGLHVAVQRGNLQSGLTYMGPPVRTALCRAGQDPSHAYDLVARVRVPKSGYQFALQTIERVGDVTRVYVRLTHPTGVTMPVVEDHRVVVGLGADPGARLELWIEEKWDHCVCLGLAAVIESKS